MIKRFLWVVCFTVILERVAARLEGDIVVDDYWTALTGGRHRSAFDESYRRWPKTGSYVKIPYVFDELTIKPATRKLILGGIEEFDNKTCVRFVPRKGEYSYVKFAGGRECSSYVGRRFGKQTVSMSAKCASRGTVVHELMHVLGFDHEHSRSDRDDHVVIHWENIKTGYKVAFKKEKKSSYDTPYDFQSIMHYSAYAYSTNNKTTITDRCLTPVQTQRKTFSELDLIKINKRYNCRTSNIRSVNPTLATTLSSSTGQGTKCKDDSPFCTKAAKCELWWYKTYCRKTCQLCVEVTTATTPQTTTSATTSALNCPTATAAIQTTKQATTNSTATLTNCRDNNKRCRKWAKFGYCENAQFRLWVNLICKRSCGTCNS